MAANKRSPGLGDLVAELAAIERMTVGELATKHQAVYGAPTRSRNKAYLRKRISWRVQELAEGGLSPRALARIAELGDALPERWRMRLNPAPRAVKRDPRLPPIGTVLTRIFQHAPHRAILREEGFEYRGELFKTLSAIAMRITGTPWNGFLFFGLRKPFAGTANTREARS